MASSEQMIKLCDERLRKELNRRQRRATAKAQKELSKRRTQYFNLLQLQKLVERSFDEPSRNTSKLSKVRAEGAVMGTLSASMALPGAALNAARSANRLTDEMYNLLHSIQTKAVTGATQFAKNILCSFVIYSKSAASLTLFLCMELLRFVLDNKKVVAFAQEKLYDLVMYLSSLPTIHRRDQVRDGGELLATVQAEAGSSDNEEVETKKTIATFGNLLSWMITGSDKTDDKVFKRKMDHFGNMFKNITFISSGTEKLMKVAAWFLNDFAPMMVTKITSFWTLRGETVDVRDIKNLCLSEFVSDVYELCVFDLKNFKNNEYLAKLNKTFDNASWLSSAIAARSTKLQSSQLTTVNNAINTIMRFYSANAVYIRYPTSTYRPTPFSVQLVGPPNAGKSTVASTLVKRLLDPGTCKKHYPTTEAYALTSLKHWDNYTAEPAVIIDDLCQQKGTSGNDESAVLSFIRLISNITYITPQAAVEAKGMPFMGDLIVSTMNVAFPDLDEIRDKTAFYRRRVLIHQERIPGVHKELYEHIGEDPESDHADWVFFIMADATDEHAYTALKNQFRAEPITAENIKRYRKDYRAMSYYELARELIKRFNKHLTCPDPEFLNKAVGSDEIEKFYTSEIDPCESYDAEPDVVAEGGYVSTLFESDEDVSSSDCHGFTYCCVPRTYAFQHPTAYTGCFVRYCFATQRAFYYARRESGRVRLHYIDARGIIPVELKRDWTMLNFVIGDVNPDNEYRQPRAHKRRTFERRCEDPTSCCSCLRRDALGWSNVDSHEVEDAVFDPVTELQAIVRNAEPTEEEQIIEDWGEWESSSSEDFDESENDDEDNLANELDNVVLAEGGRMDDIIAFGEKLANAMKVKYEELIEIIKRIPKHVLALLGSLVLIGTVAASLSIYQRIFGKSDKAAKTTKMVVEVPDYLVEEVHEMCDDLNAEVKLAEATLNRIAKNKSTFRNAVSSVHDVLAQSGHAYDANARTKPGMKLTLSPKMINKVVAQAFVGQSNAEEVGRKIATGNSLKFVATGRSGAMYTTSALGIGKRTVVVPGHLVRFMQTHCQNVNVWHRGIEFKNIDINWDKAYSYDDFDLYVIEMPLKFPMMPSITKHIQTLEEESTTVNRYVYYAFDAHTNRLESERVGGYAVKETHYNFETEDVEIDCRLLKGYRIGTHYGSGYCGSFIINEATGKVCGMHVAGNKVEKFTLCAPLTIELIEQATIAPEDVVDETLAEAAKICKPVKNHIMQSTGVVEYIGTAGIEYHQQPPKENKWKATKLGGHSDPMFEIRKEPSVMSLRDYRVDEEVRAAGRTPLQLGLDKSSEQAIEFSPKTIDRAVSAVKASMSRMKAGKVGKRLLTEYEIINGVIDESGGGRYYDGMDMKTATGLPYRHLAAKTGLPGKLAYFQELAEVGPSGEKLYAVRDNYNNIPTGSILMNEYEKAREKLMRGEIPFFVNAQNLKMETLKLSKIKSAGTRSFECLPMHISMLVRELFGGFFEFLQVNCDQYPVSVGIAAQKGDWTRLYRRLKRFGGKVVAGDYKQWDGKLMPCIMRAAIEIVNAWYGDAPGSPSAKARIALAEAHSHGYVAAVNDIMRKHGGMPSGSPMTSPINSICNWLNILCATIDIMERKGFTVQTDDLVSDIELAVYGDDHVVAYGPAFLGKVTFRDFYKLFNELGLGYTDSIKSGKVDFDYEELEETTYLKRKFVPFKGYCLAPLDIVSIENMPLWYEARNRVREEDILKEKKISFVEELGMHTRMVFDEHVAIWNAHIQKLKDQQSLMCENGDYPFINNTHAEVQGEILKGISETA